MSAASLRIARSALAKHGWLLVQAFSLGMAMPMFGCRPEPPAPPPPPLAEGWKRLTPAHTFSVDVPDSVKELPPGFRIDVMPGDLPLPVEEGRMRGAGCYFAWNVFRSPERPDYWHFSDADVRGASKRPFYWTELSDMSQERGLRRFTSAERLVIGNVLLADSRWLVHVAVIDSLPGDSAKVKQILGSVRLVTYDP